MKRAFIVGCPRSGTTLLQSMVAAHPDVISFPESHFFTSLVSARPWLRALGLASRMARRQFVTFLRNAGHKEMIRFLPWYAVSMRRYARAFVFIMDSLAQQQKLSIWVEKTPRHLHYIPYIERFVPGAQFIHILRNGQDVVASLYEVTHQFPDVWGGKMDIEASITRWRHDVKISLSYRNQPNHHLVRYESMTQDPHTVLKGICEFLGFPFDQAMFEEYGETAVKVILLEEEAWKAKNHQQVYKTTSRKFQQLFSLEQRQAILKRVSDIDLEHLLTESDEGDS